MELDSSYQELTKNLELKTESAMSELESRDQDQDREFSKNHNIVYVYPGGSRTPKLL